MIKGIEGKIPDISNLATKTNLSRKINEAKNDIPSISNFSNNFCIDCC